VKVIECVRSFVVERFVNSDGIVKCSDVREHAQRGISHVAERLELRPFVLERPEESFHHSVVLAASGTTIRTLDPERPQRFSVDITSVLETSVTLVHQAARSRATALNRFSKRFADTRDGDLSEIAKKTTLRLSNPARPQDKPNPSWTNATRVSSHEGVFHSW
jgi:hypothetical protein